jgi:hypothetical protein
MKTEDTMRSLPAILILSLVLIFACKKSTEPPKGISPGMRATIDGQSWTADSSAALDVTVSGGGYTGQSLGAIIGIKQVFQDLTIIELDIPELKTGNYSTSMNNLVAIYLHGYAEQDQGFLDYYFAVPPSATDFPKTGSASLTISKMDGKKAEGKFSFVAYDSLGTDSVKVMSATFNVTVTETTIDLSEKQNLHQEKPMLLPDISRKYFNNLYEWE